MAAGPAAAADGHRTPASKINQPGPHPAGQRLVHPNPSPPHWAELQAPGLFFQRELAARSPGEPGKAGSWCKGLRTGQTLP